MASTLVPYGFDCYSFNPNEIQYFTNVTNRRSNGRDYVSFTRKDEYYTKKQTEALVAAGRLKPRGPTAGKHVFCGLKIQLGILVVTNFLKLGLQYKRPNPGRSDLINGTWTGIVGGLTTKPGRNESDYEIAFGNFLAYAEEFPYIKFGPFFAIESKLVLLTGSARSIIQSSFGTNVNSIVWTIICAIVLLLSILAAYENNYRFQKHLRATTKISANENLDKKLGSVHDFVFIYLTMILNKPSIEFEHFAYGETKERFRLPTASKTLSYLWSAACLVMSTVYSGELLAVILLSVDQKIDNIAQLLNTKPSIIPVIRQDDFTYELMRRSQDENMRLLHNRTRVIPRTEVFSKNFVESVAKREVALLGDDELIETIFETYNHYFRLYRSSTTYLQYPISIMYHKDLERDLEHKLRQGVRQAFETGVIRRWYDAQKEFYINYHDHETNEEVDTKSLKQEDSNSQYSYAPLTINHFRSFFSIMSIGLGFSMIVFIAELAYFHMVESRRQ